MSEGFISSGLSRRSLLAGLASAPAMASLLAGPAGAQAPVTGGAFTIPVISNPALWPLIGGVQNVMVNRVLFNSLTSYDDPNQKVVGDLAEKWSVSTDGLTWTFSLYPNVTWHDGKPFTADDVVFTINKIWLNPKIAFPQRSNFATLTGAEKVDERTVKLTTNVPTPALPVMLGYLAPILPAHIFSTWSNEDFTKPTAFTKSPVGTGPFKFGEFTPGSSVRLVRNDAYFRGKPLLDALVFKVMPDVEQQFAQLQSGQLDWMIIEPYQIDALKGNTRVKINDVKSNMYFYVGLNDAMPPFDDKRVRQAFSYAVDRQAIIDGALAGRADIAASPITPVLANFHNDKVESYAIDLKKAGELLDQAGWKMGSGGIRTKDGKQLKITLDVDAGNTTREQIALIVQDNWKKIGVDTTIKTGDFGAFVQRMRAKPSELQAFICWWITAPDPDIISYYGTDKTLNIFAYSNPEVDKLLDEGRKTIDLAQRAKLYKDAQVLIAQDAPCVFLYYAREIESVSANLRGWSPTLGYRYALGQAEKIWKAR
ncbi:peptide/nickel transport system substrate-binding protein [Bosea sp. BK604]|nr:peptide/nickel transport system substrate-binding protein [Bosea sp. BK604]